MGEPVTTLYLFILCVWAGCATAHAFRAHHRHTEHLDRIGRTYGVGRWPQEGNDQYADRIRTRIVIGNGVTWRN